MLGLYDSGLGGLTVLAALRAAGITQDVVYFADHAHNPYGDKSEAEIHGYLRHNLALLAEQRVGAVITACNTSCAVAQRLGWPEIAVPVLDLIATAGASFAGTPHRRIAVIATAATVRSGAYARALRAAAPYAAVHEIAAPKLVPLVERGETETPAARDAVAEIVAQLPPDTGAIVYGCTHYPLLDAHFAQLLAPHVARIDPAAAQAAATAALVAARHLPAGSARTTYYTNGDATSFESAVRRWTGDTTGRVAALVPG
ncbi:MAG TPA: glutamate racemase [Candidatus Elarobacter sp.]|nr:glutamate racemase [Candidatus Elarobacter sp.]